MKRYLLLLIFLIPWINSFGANPIQLTPQMMKKEECFGRCSITKKNCYYTQIETRIGTQVAQKCKGRNALEKEKCIRLEGNNFLLKDNRAKEVQLICSKPFGNCVSSCNRI